MNKNLSHIYIQRHIFLKLSFLCIVFFVLKNYFSRDCLNNLFETINIEASETVSGGISIYRVGNVGIIDGYINGSYSPNLRNVIFTLPSNIINNFNGDIDILAYNYINRQQFYNILFTDENKNKFKLSGTSDGIKIIGTVVFE